MVQLNDRHQSASRTGREQGSVAIMIAASLTVLTGIAAVAIDLADSRQRRAQAQNAADFGALAAAAVLESGTIPQAIAAARDYVSRNGFSGAGAAVDIPPTAGTRAGDLGCIEVQVTEEHSTTFGRVFGIDSATVSARAVACGSPPRGGPYAVFAGSSTCQDTLDISGANRLINGAVHSNRDIKNTSLGTINGSTTYRSGTIPNETMSYVPAVNNPRKIVPILPYPDNFEITDYQPGGRVAVEAAADGQYVSTTQMIDLAWLQAAGKYNPATGVIAPGLYFSTGEIRLNDNNIRALGVTLVSSGGMILFNGNDFVATPWSGAEGLLLFSNKYFLNTCTHSNAVIKLNGNHHSWEGVMFAPRGPLLFNGEGIVAELNGRLVANIIQLGGFSHSITRNLSIPGAVDRVELVE